MSFMNSKVSKYSKHFIPLKSNPDVFRSLIHSLGASPSLNFQDIYSIIDEDLLAIIPHPVLALVLVFPTTETYEEAKTANEASRKEYAGKTENGDEDVVWYKQTINNACGLYVILHAVSNGPARTSVLPQSTLDQIVRTAESLDTGTTAKFLVESQELENAYTAVARQGDTQAPDDPEDEVDYHYICFDKGGTTGRLYELDGERKGPIDHGSLAPDEDLPSEAALRPVKEYIEREKDSNIRFSLMALVQE
ncbi:ubiquitin carboxyl-terminal hydrolase, family 1 [Patellaria atrata CBS 101060]|uniref:Ubiquitin carboxyl-terminal hydrolase n=1 Tax=Patellaria atrata CBS 101060 TaxID=1346257 RepID=A0A9P4VRE9_9PEZI|nr:ubiquitin carboxyl-terminal hydrolase, family 1 [Patellaria atrata CBS 101060]